MSKEVNNKIDEIINDIENSPEYQKYLSLKEMISKDKKLKELINKTRVLQKDYVHHLIDKGKLDEMLEELNNYPLYREYNNSLYEINNIYGIIENTLNSYFQNKIN